MPEFFYTYGPLLLVILSNTLYHFISRSSSQTINPFAALILTYSVALVCSILLFSVTKKESLVVEFSKANLFNFLLGVVILGLEGGFLLMYQHGWEISQGSLMANTAVAILLVLIGYFFFKEGMDLKKFMGILLCLVGVWMISST